jgi:hypothetical protein
LIDARSEAERLAHRSNQIGSQTSTIGIQPYTIDPQAVRLARLGLAKRLRIQFLAARLLAFGTAPVAHLPREIEMRADIRAALEEYLRIKIGGAA